MVQHDDINYLIYLEEDRIPLDGSMTVGNHLENDIVVAGEDVADYHVRVEVASRGPVVIPLGGATVNINGVETDKPIGVIAGDLMGVGSATMQFGYELENNQAAIEAWQLCAENGEANVNIQGEVSVGRRHEADLCILDTHISRHHARLLERDQIVWLQDLGSSNGSRVNGTRVVGGARLFHGDTVSFDQFTYQLVGAGGDLTPVHQFVNPEQGTSLHPPGTEPSYTTPPRTPPETDLVGVATRDSQQDTLQDTLQITEQELSSASSAGASDAAINTQSRVGGYCLEVLDVDRPDSVVEVLQLPVGDSLLGTDAACTLRLSGPGLLARHARIAVKPEGCVITNLAQPEGVTVNGSPISSLRIAAGDEIVLGGTRLRLGLETMAPTVGIARQWQLAPTLLAAGSGVALLLAITLLILL